jgi:hypothetical protein
MIIHRQMLLGGGSGEVDVYGWKVVVWSVGVVVVWEDSFLLFWLTEVPRMMVVKKRWW